jgi:hypothetical protein
MASGKTVGSLYLSLGLDISELEYGFALADRTVSQAISRFNHEAQNLRFQAQIDTNNAESSIERLRIQYESLGKQIDNARQKEMLLLRNLEATRNSLGANNPLTAKAETALKRQQVYISNLTRQQRELKATMDLSSSSVINFADAMRAARGGAMGLANYIAALVPEVAALTAVVGAGLGLASITKEAADAAASIGDLGDQLGIGTEAAAQLQGTLKAAGVETEGFVGFITKLDKSVKSAGENGNEVTRTLSRFGVSLTDDTGKLVDYNEQLRRLAEAYQNAKASGNVEDFFAGIGARGAAYRDLLNKFEEYSRRGGDMYGTGLKDVAGEAMQATDAIGEVGEKLDSLKQAFAAAFVPIINDVLPPLIEQLKNIRNLMDENTEAVSLFARGLYEAATFNPLTAGLKGRDLLLGKDNSAEQVEKAERAQREAAQKTARAAAQAEREAKAVADAELKAQTENAEAIAAIWRKATASKLENDLAAIDARMKKELEAANLTEQGKARIQERYAAEKQVAITKTAQEVARMDRELSDSIAKQTKGELENALRDIDRQAEATRKKYIDLYGSVSEKTDELIQRNADLQRQNAIQSRADKALTSEKKYWDIFQKAMSGQTMGFNGGFKMFDLTGDMDARLKAAEEAIRAEMLKSRGITNATVKTSDLQMFDALMKRVQGGGLANVVDDAGIMGEKVAAAVSTSLQGVTDSMAQGMNAGLAPALDKMSAQDGQYQSAALSQYESIRQAVDNLAARMEKKDTLAPTITVQIDSAVTEDSASMTRLADSVADRINEVLVRYIGDSHGGTNTY